MNKSPFSLDKYIKKQLEISGVDPDSAGKGCPDNAFLAHEEVKVKEEK